MKIRLLAFLTSLMIFCSAGFSADGFENNLAQNTILKPNIKTVILSKEGFQPGAPVIRLNSPDKLKLSFDDLEGDLKYFKFTIIHCQSDWTISPDLRPLDYIIGNQEDNIDDYSYSFNTTVHYTHYSLIFPTPGLQPRLSGNYLMLVYTDNPDDPAFIWRFMVYETSAITVSGSIHQANIIADRLSKQQIDFTIDYKGMFIDNPERNMKVVITQNDRIDNALHTFKPSFIKAGSLEYTNNDLISFEGGNEFRSFDIKSLIYQSERIRGIQNDENGYHVYLLDDSRRMLKNYASEKDINGRKLIKSDDHATNSEIEADYTWVTFSLPYPAALTNGKIYILGSLTDWQLNDSSLMTYDFEKKKYTKQLFLKQGYYDYLYLFSDRLNGKQDISFIEGSHWETENEYTLWVYYRASGDLYDRLLAVQNLNSLK